jgi:xanthine dehydrogenase YagR molybdenum-binding subunit
MSIGDPVPRPDGRDKVTGRAKYAADQVVPNLLYATYVTSTIPSGRVTAIDATAALAVPGVVRVLTPADMPRLANAPVPPLASSFVPMQNDDVRYDGQPIAMVLGETLEAAEQAARLVRVQYQASAFRTFDRVDTVDPAKENNGYHFGESIDFRKGDIDAGLAAATLQQHAKYIQPSRHHNPMEPSATIAQWDGDRLTAYDSVQHGYGTQFILSTLFGVAPEHVRIICPHTGGGFGCKGYIWPQEVLAAAAAKVVGRPVKLVVTRSQMYSTVGYQPHIEHTMTLGADDRGQLTTLQHEMVSLTSVSDDYIEWGTEASKSLYATPTMRLRQRVRRAHVNTPTAMRAPVDGPGMWALESAMDELAHALQMDPLDLRLANYAVVDPANDKPWSSKKLLQAYEEGARLFGWRERSREPRRDGAWLLGTGMASATMGVFRMPSTVRLTFRADGTGVIQSGFHDIGTGTLTIFPQIAADTLGVDPSAIACEMGDTTLPQAGPTYGSSSTIGVGAATLQAAQNVRAQLAKLVGLKPDSFMLRDGRIFCPDADIDGKLITDIMRNAGVSELASDGAFTLPGNAPFDGGGSTTPYAMRTWGAVFVEVAVDLELGLLRLRRVVGSYSVGRIINPRTARSQMTGGIIWGWGMAAMEASQHDPVLGRWLSKNLAGVAIPVNADIPNDITINFVDEFDEHAGPLGAKGIGELGATGVAAAVANAVFHATGRRMRELPITADKLLAG